MESSVLKKQVIVVITKFVIRLRYINPTKIRVIVVQAYAHRRLDITVKIHPTMFVVQEILV